MTIEVRRFAYRREFAQQTQWHETAREFGMYSDADPGCSLGSEFRAWQLGRVFFLAGDVRGQTLTPMSADASQWSADYVSIKLITGGEMWIEETSATHRIGSGDFVLLDAQRPYKAITPERATGFVMRMPRQALMERGFRTALDHVRLPDLSSPDVQLVRALIECVGGLSRRPSADVMQRVSDQLLDLMDIVLERPTASGRRRTAAAMVRQAKQFIARHAGDPDLTPALIAAHVCISSKHLGRLFSAQGGSLMRYVLSVRLEQAARLLKATPWHRNLVQQIAYQCGFSSASHFSHAFKRRYGVAPADVFGSPHFPVEPRASVPTEI
ncbi:AraC family transcriptional regulator [Paraburkholderia rhizosphaerae]|uniref:AraC family transcriptional regulator n=2 Tax=Paraburkholderia rhizosphaerae TaxID=480658 RepID=A0A4R8L481_9BURK|nr:AraC family transcriptional regulator [Paraburkholderia rhizosphaerae]